MTKYIIFNSNNKSHSGMEIERNGDKIIFNKTEIGSDLKDTERVEYYQKVSTYMNQTWKFRFYSVDFPKRTYNFLDYEVTKNAEAVVGANPPEPGTGTAGSSGN